MYTFDLMMDDAEPPSFHLWQFAVFYEFRALESYCIRNPDVLRELIPRFQEMYFRGSRTDWEWILDYRGTRDSLWSITNAIDELLPEMGLDKWLRNSAEDEGFVPEEQE
jgi:hypothetical protein